MREQGIVAGGCGHAGSSGSQRRMELRLLCLISYHSAFTDQQGLWVIRDKTWIVPHLSCAAGRSQTWRLAFGICGVVVQLVRTPACQAGGRRFEPGRPRHELKHLQPAFSPAEPFVTRITTQPPQNFLKGTSPARSAWRPVSPGPLPLRLDSDVAVVGEKYIFVNASPRLC